MEDILGKDDTQFLPPDVVTALRAIDRTVMRTGRSQIFEEQIPENGEIRTFLSTKDPYVDAQGNIAGIIGIARDITDRKQAEEQIQKAAKRLAALQEIDRSILRLESPAEITQAAISRLLQVVEAEQAAVLLFNFERGEFEILAGEIGGDRVGTVRQIADSVSPEVLLNREAVWYIQDLAMLVQRSAFGEKLLAAGYHSFLAVALMIAGKFTGDLLLVKRKPNAFSAEDREIVHEVANQLAIAIQQSQLRDQLQRYATELEHRVAERTAELEVINRELEAFTYSVSHDLRAPLRTIQGFAQALLEDSGDQLDELGKNYIHSIIEDSMQMSGLIADLLAYSRLSRTQINPQLVDLNKAIKEALKQVATEVQEKQANITIAELLPSVLAHRATLIQVLVNLLSNALKFVELGTQARVNIYTKEEQHDRQTWVKLYVEDNGIGIAPEHQERIFRVFERLHGAETYPGTGIGLAIVRKGLERMGGDAGVESQLGHASRFWIALPKVLTQQRMTTRLLLIDDNKSDRTLVLRELQREFSQLDVQEIISSGEFNLAIVAGEFDAVITDFQLRWATGLDVLQASDILSRNA
ncbi:sensor histidine kinase [Gloeocapsopsis dulcis]|uniref:sensor histidine kinase n=1 Tax=Gloeocapsopsis dulcis TaxID=2859516 RepID=UPI001914ACE9|nr:ATP-binding protein [Gloeocapsopsis dulcis]